MVFMGENAGAPMISEAFEAWDYGPVVPSLYHRVKMFGRNPIKDIFYNEDALGELSSEGLVIKRAVNSLAKRSASELVAITHWERGAWAKHYKNGRLGIKIPNADILTEFKEIFQKDA